VTDFAKLKLAIYNISKGDFDATDDEVRQIAIAASEARAAPSLRDEKKLINIALGLMDAPKDANLVFEVANLLRKLEEMQAKADDYDRLAEIARNRRHQLELAEASATGAEPAGLTLAVIGRKHFGNPIPPEWYAAAKELLATPTSAAVQATHAKIEAHFGLTEAQARSIVEAAHRRPSPSAQEPIAAAPVHEGLTDAQILQMWRATNKNVHQGDILDMDLTMFARVVISAALEAGKEGEAK
jgi:hypothetical protein